MSFKPFRYCLWITKGSGHLKGPLEPTCDTVGGRTGGGRWSLELAENFSAGLFPQLRVCCFEILAEGPPTPAHVVSLHRKTTRSLFALRILLSKTRKNLKKKKISFPVKA